MQKINHHNAFEVPVIVANPNSASDDNMRFWKFASELLHASIYIYDKRVDNLSIETDKMSGKMTWINSSEDKDN